MKAAIASLAFLAAMILKANGQGFLSDLGFPSIDASQTLRSRNAVRNLLAHSRPAEDRALEERMDFSYIADYSIKFQGCHHIRQWNGDVDGDDDVRIRTKRLVRFRLCPSSSCDDSKDVGCSSKFGDYIVDINTFVYYYLTAIAEDKANTCGNYDNTCYNNCYGSSDKYSCLVNCYAGYGLSGCVDDADLVENFDPLDYAMCAQYENFKASDDDNNVKYYVGPHCAEQGGTINFALFTDETCTSFSNCGDSCFYSIMGYYLPFSTHDLVSANCLSCSNYNNNNNNNNNNYVRDVCKSIYGVSGKCETKMAVDYPNESACTYVEGIKIIREDGVIRTTSVRKSKSAAVAIGLFTTSAVMLGAYVYYLRIKLSRAKINLTTATASLT